MYARPYVAGFELKTQIVNQYAPYNLWVGKDEWLKDLRSWWRKDWVRLSIVDLVDAVTSATRPAGEYKFVWDGLNDKGQRVEQGSYTFLRGSSA